jgi:hypothetical protein
MTAPAPAARRELTAVVVLCLAGGALALWATTRTWADLSTPRPAPLPPIVATVTGGDAAPLAAALALVALAGAAALPAARGLLRTAVGVLLLLAGAGVATGGVHTLVAGVPGESPVTDVRLTATWPVLTVAGGALVAVAGLVAIVRGRRWSALGRRYDAPSPAAPPQTGDLWAAQDRGEDPTRHPDGEHPAQNGH